MTFHPEVRGSGRTRRSGLAAVVLGGALGVGSMSGCGAALIAGAGYLAAEEIARGQRRVAYDSYVRQHNATTVDGRLWKGQPLETYAATLNERTFGRLEIHEKGVQFDNEGVTIGNRSVPFWWASIPYSSIKGVSYSERTTTLLGYSGDDILTVRWEDVNGRLNDYGFKIEGVDNIDAAGLANRVQDKVNGSRRSSLHLQTNSDALYMRAVEVVNSMGITDPKERELAIQLAIQGYLDGVRDGARSVSRDK